MGPSGAGKTTLLKCLSGRLYKGLSEESEIYLKKDQRINTCFVTQNICEHLLNGLTVRQTLIYASKLKNSRINCDINYDKIISDLVNELLINDVMDSCVDSCSGGEQKRIAIAAELTAYSKPNILYIDEPTSGLDSNAAEVVFIILIIILSNIISLLYLQVIQCLKSLSRRHQICVITSIHQPNNDLFHMFDNIYVLAKGGVNIYSGVPHNLRQFLSDSEIECNENDIPIERVLDISCEGKDNELIQKLVQKTLILSSISYITERMALVYGKQTISKRISFRDFYYLLMRTMVYSYSHKWKSLFIQFLCYQIIGLSFRFFFNPDMIKPNGCLDLDDIGCDETFQKLIETTLLKENIRYIVITLCSFAFVVVMTTSLDFCVDYKVFINEHQNGI